MFIFGQSASLRTQDSVYDFNIRSIDGGELPLSAYKGKVIVVVNVASQSPLSGQLKTLQRFYTHNRNKEIVVLGFPSNSFKNEPLDTDKKVRIHYRSKFGVHFPLSGLVNVRGANQHPLFQFFEQKSLNKTMDAPINMDFQKFIIDRNGRFVATIEPNVDINDEAATQLINSFL